MADIKISELPTGSASDTDVIPVVDGGATKKISLSALSAYLRSSGWDVTGTVTADGLDILVDADDRITFTTLSGDALINSLNNTYSAYQPLLINGSDLRFLTGALERARIDSSGNVGIGTSSPTAKLDIQGTSDSSVNAKVNGSLQVWDKNTISRGSSFLSIDSANGMVGGNLRLDASVTTGTHVGYAKGTAQRGSSAIKFYLPSANGTYGTTHFLASSDTGDDTWSTVERMTIDGLGKVGIGTSSPDRKLTVQGSSGDNLPVRIIGGSGTSKAHLEFQDASTTANYKVTLGSVGDNLTLQAGGYERMRIDSSGNVLVGKTALSASTNGVEARADGELTCSKNGISFSANRNGSDGAIGVFKKDGSTVGSIGSASFSGSSVSRPYFTNHSSDGLGIHYINSTNAAIVPIRGNAEVDDAGYLGDEDHRWKDLYLSGGVYLGGTGAANKLDDYEEGTFTPSLGGTWTTNPTNLTGYYRKVGAMVHVAVFFTGGAKTSSTSGYFTGMPFNISVSNVGSVSDSAVVDRQNCLLANTDRMWLTATSFYTGTNRASCIYYTAL